MKKYKSYRNSGLSWLGYIPESWKTVRNKHIFYEVSDCKSTGEETLLTVSHITGVTPRSEKNVNMFFAETMAGYKKVKEGDLIINTMWAWMGALGVTKERGICSPAYNVYRNNKNVDYYAMYFDYLFRTPNFIIEMTRFSKGIVDSRLRLYPKDFYRIYTCLPSFQEQKAIANYLDIKTQAIDKKVNLLEKKIGYYQELGKSLINQTVTKGLNKNVKLKESRIDLGDLHLIKPIPEHWSIHRVDWIASLIRGNTGFGKDDLLHNGEYVALQYGKTYQVDEVNSSFQYFVNGEFYKQTQIVNSGDTILISTSETIEDLGHSCFYNRDDLGLIGGEQILLKPNRKLVNGKYLYYRSKEFGAELRKNATGLKVFRFNIDDLKQIFVAIPPLEEQIQIANYLTEKTSKIGQIIANIQAQITTLKELRKTLINDVVTGKIKGI